MILSLIQTSQDAIRSTVESLQQIYTIVFALAIAEAFRQFVADRADPTEDRTIHWDRLFALISLLVLVVPFYQGMTQYLFDVYIEVSERSPRPSPYGVYLLIDCVVFTVESGFFFVLSRSLPGKQWQRFYWTVVVLLVLDVVWGSFVLIRDALNITRNLPDIKWWVILNIVCSVLLIVTILLLRKLCQPESWWGRVVAMLIVTARTVADYITSWDIYFPQN